MLFLQALFDNNSTLLTQLGAVWLGVHLRNWTEERGCLSGCLGRVAAGQ